MKIENLSGLDLAPARKNMKKIYKVMSNSQFSIKLVQILITYIQTIYSRLVWLHFINLRIYIAEIWPLLISGVLLIIGTTTLLLWKLVIILFLLQYTKHVYKSHLIISGMTANFNCYVIFYKIMWICNLPVHVKCIINTPSLYWFNRNNIFKSKFITKTSGNLMSVIPSFPVRHVMVFCLGHSRSNIYSLPNDSTKHFKWKFQTSNQL